MTANGNCYIVLPELCAGSNLLVGRNSEDDAALGVAQEVHYYDTSEALAGKTDGGANVTAEHDLCRVILEKPRPGVWGGDCGANDQNVYVAVTWSADEPAAGEAESLLASDIVRIALALSTSAQAVVAQIGALVSEHSAAQAKLSFVACDPNEAWLISCAGKLWAAQQLKESLHCVRCDGLAVTTAIDKSCAELEAQLKQLGVWSEGTPLDFAACFGASASVGVWPGAEPSAERKFTQSAMFETLRAAANAESSRSASVAVLNPTAISCYWFTATPNASESVFKPFVFSPQPRISPLTKVLDDDGDELTLLHKLHSQRKPAALESLRTLESACVEEVNAHLAAQSTADEELDELLKDCVEAEVKFYR